MQNQLKSFQFIGNLKETVIEAEKLSLSQVTEKQGRAQ
jgi:hypothetical protein